MKNLYKLLSALSAAAVIIATSTVCPMKIVASDDEAESLRREYAAYEGVLDEAREVGNPVMAKFAREKLREIAARRFQLEHFAE